MNVFEDQPCIGLFGTCGDSTFRQDMFIPRYKQLGIAYFNPQVADWKPELAEIESQHLLYDMVQCWPVLSCTSGLGSLAEQGFSIASTLRAPSPLPKFVIPMVEMAVDDQACDEAVRAESLRARKLADTHLRNCESPFVYVAESLDEMLALSIGLYGAAKVLAEASRSYNPPLQRFVETRSRQQALEEAIRCGKLKIS